MSMVPRLRARATGGLLPIAVAAASSLIFAAGTAWGTVYTYENSTSASIPEVTTSDAACNTSGLAVTFSVPDSFTVATVSLGLNATHATRGQIRAILNAPGGSSFVMVAQTTNESDDTDDNYDIYLSPLSDGTNTNPRDDSSADPTAEPYYHRLVNVSSNFYAGNASGTWTLRICDRFAGTTGTFNRARLVLTSAATPTAVCTSRTSFDFCPGCATPPPDTSTPFPAGGITADNVTVTLTSTTLNNATPSARNFTQVNTQTGGEWGYYVDEWDAANGQAEQVQSEMLFALTPAVNDLQWQLMDMDRNSWEDYVRVRGLYGANEVRYSFAPSAAPSYQYNGEIVETDSNSQPADTYGNGTWNFSGPVSSVRTEYWAGDDFNNPNQQFIGVGAALFCAYDFGDAPTAYGPAGQLLGARTLYLGARPPDGEAVTPASPGVNADNDDANNPTGGTDDEDGVPSFPGADLAPGSTYTVPNITVTNATGAAATLCGWIDFDVNGQAGSGAFAADEGSCITIPASGSNASCTGSGSVFTCTMVWTVPADFVWNSSSTTYARFRVSNGTLTTSAFNDVAAGAPSTNPGEVEDYRIDAGTLPVTVARVESESDGGRLTVRWTTSTESANAFFQVWGRTADGAWHLLDRVPSQDPDSFEPRHYQTTVDGIGIEAIKVEDMSLFGDRREHGPFPVGVPAGEEPQGAPIDWAAVRDEAGLSPVGTLALPVAKASRRIGAMAAATAAREGLLLVREEGIQRVTHEDLLAAGIDLSGTRASDIAILDDGKAVARYVSAPATGFGPGSYVEFVARPALTLASPVDAFVIKVDRRKALAAVSFQATPGSLGTTATADRYHPDHEYGYGSPTDDPWYDQYLFALGSPASLTRTFDLPDLAGGKVSLDIAGWGYSEWPGEGQPDHHVVVTLNGRQIADDRFDGVSVWKRSVDVTGIATAAGNVLEVRLPGDTGFQFDLVAFEGYDARYTRQAVARSGRFQGSLAGWRSASIGGFPAGATVSVWRDNRGTAQRLEGTAQGGSVAAPPGFTLWAASSGAFLAPAIVAGVPTAQSSSNAQYLVIAHPAFADGLDDLLELRRGQGLSTEVVTVDEIYAANSDYVASPDAIRKFLKASLQRGHVKYVLLVGADTTDPWDHRGTGAVSFVPTSYLPYVQYVNYSPTDETLADTNGDGLAEVPIGRLPVRTPAELQAMVAKIVAFEGNGSGRSALLTSGASDTVGALPALNLAYAAKLAGWGPSLANADEVGAAAVHNAILAAINSGTPLVSFLGHSSVDAWDFNPVLRISDVTGFTNAGQPSLIAQWGCWNAYHVSPVTEALAVRMLRVPDVGAAAAIGATTLTSDASHQALGTLFFAQLDAGAATVGDAFQGAKRQLKQQGGMDDAILGMALLGDPAMRLPH